jgi:hypothetical protein
MATKIQLRRGTSSQWNTSNPTLSDGEIGFETNTNKFKIGNGEDSWSLLEYFVGGIDIDEYLTISSASTTYITQDSASNTYLTQASASTTYLSEIPQLQLIDTQVFNSSGTYVVPSGATEIKVEAVGAGSGGWGGNVRKTPTGLSVPGGDPGEGGTYFEFYKKTFDLSSSSVSVIIGSGGLGGNSASTSSSSGTFGPTVFPSKGGDSYFDNIFIPGSYTYTGTNIRFYDTFVYNSIVFIKTPKSANSDSFKGGGNGGTGGGHRGFDNALTSASLGGSSKNDISLIVSSTGITQRNGSGSIGTSSTVFSVPGGNAIPSTNPGDGGPGGGAIVVTGAQNIVAGNGANGTNPGGGGGGGGSAVLVSGSDPGNTVTSGSGGNGGNARITVKAYGYI